MFRKCLFSLIVVLLFSASAWAQVAGPTGLPSSIENAELLYAPVHIEYRTDDIPIPLPAPVRAEEIGATFLPFWSGVSWSVDPTVGELTSPELPALTADQQAAVDIAPDWLKPALARKFYRLDADLADELAAMILDPEDELYTDELAFCVAYIAKEDLEDMDGAVELLTQNVRQIYEVDALLDYVEIVEVGTIGQGDYGTTLSYRVGVPDDDAVDDFEIPMDIYYWYVVHPRLSDENPNFIKPSNGGETSPANGGVFWRDYLINDAADDNDSFAATMYMVGIDEADLQNLSPSAAGYFGDMAIHNLEIAYAGDTTDVVFTEFAYGSGTIFAATLDLTEAYTKNDCPLLENLLNQGNGDILLPEDSPIALLSNEAIPTSWQDALTALGRWEDVTVISSTDLAGYSEEAWATFKSTYKKAVVMPYQAIEFYETICSETVKAQLEAFAADWKVLELHIVPTRAAAAKALADLTYPGNFGFTAQTINDVTVYGRPLLFDMLAGVDLLWDGLEHPSMSGDRPLWDNADAVQAVGNFVGKNTLDNVSERQTITGTIPARSVQPVRILFTHYGNCGELQDLAGAAMRAALIPGLLISDMNEDHVWNEFYHDGQWYVYQNSWSNADTQIARPGGTQDVDYGGGKDTSFMLAWLGDGNIESVSERYSNTITLAFNLTDSNGAPVPDALIEIHGETWMSTSTRVGHWMLSDANGHAEVKLGDKRNYYIRILGPIGDYPEQSGAHARLVVMAEADEAIADTVFTLDHQFERPLIDVTVDSATSTVNDSLGLHVQVLPTHRFTNAINQFSGIYAQSEDQPPTVDAYLVDDANLELAENFEPFTAAWAQTGVGSLDELIYPPTAGNWNLLLINHSSSASDHLADVSVTVEGDPWIPTDDDTSDDDATDDDDASGGDDDDDNDDDGCGC